MYLDYIMLLEWKYLPLLLLQKHLPSLHDKLSSPLPNSSLLLLTFLGVALVLHVVNGEVQHGIFFHREQLKSDTIMFNRLILTSAKTKASELSQRSLAYSCNSSWYDCEGGTNLSKGVQLYHPLIDELIPPGTNLTGVQIKHYTTIEAVASSLNPKRNGHFLSSD